MFAKRANDRAGVALINFDLAAEGLCLWAKYGETILRQEQVEWRQLVPLYLRGPVTQSKSPAAVARWELVKLPARSSPPV